MAYCTTADLRQEGVTYEQAEDDRLELLIDEATGTIDRITGWFFNPRHLTIRMDGRGTPVLDPPVPPIQISSLTVNGTDWPLATAPMDVIGAPVTPGFVSPRIVLLGGRVFNKGRGNVSIRGWWGYTEPDGTDLGRVPLEIKRACMMLVLRRLPLLADTDAVEDARSRWRVIEEKTRDQSYKLDRPMGKAPITNDPELDAILLAYRKPMMLGAA